MSFQDDPGWARAQDAADPLARFRGEFLFPQGVDLYFAGHSLGLQPRRAREYVVAELDSWARYGVDGHFEGPHPWMPYHEALAAPTARLVGALPHEVVVMNTLTVNLHLLLVSFYRPTRERFRIVVEEGACSNQFLRHQRGQVVGRRRSHSTRRHELAPDRKQ